MAVRKGYEEKSAADLAVVKTIADYRREAEQARKRRLDLSRRNMDAYMGVQDWRHKIAGQSTEFLPRVATATEQFAAFIKRSLTQFGEWYSVEFGRDLDFPLTPVHVQSLLNAYFSDMPIGASQSTSLDVVLSDGAKAGILEANIILKVHGRHVERRSFSVERGEALLGEDGLEEGFDEDLLVAETTEPWRLCIDLVRLEDFYEDPTGRGLYRIHRVERDFHEVLQDAEHGMYDMECVERIEAGFTEKENKRPAYQRGHNETHSPKARKSVVIDEFWGTILDDKGRVVASNVLAAVANDKYLIRPPQPNPLWHQEDPFEKIPLIRVPHSVWHKALMDHGSSLNLALNGLFNLMLDGGMASVWGTRQLRSYALEDDTDIEAGIPQGKTLVVNEQLPVGAKVLETVTEGTVPQDAMAMFEALGSEFVQAVLTNDIKMGSLPPRQVKATEVVESNNASAITLDAVTSEIERGLERMIRKAWMTILQNADDLSSDKVTRAVGTQAAAALSLLSPAKRFAAFADACSFMVHGLSATLSRVRDFQKLMALMQAVQNSPLLLVAFMKRFSGNKALTTLMKQLNINPESIEKDASERATEGEDAQMMQTLGQMMGGGAGKQQAKTTSTEGIGEPELPAEINQMGNPLSGL